MTQKCTVCYHPESFAINEAIIVEGSGVRNISKRFDVSASAVQRHKAHIPKLLLKAQENMDAYDAGAILHKIQDLELATLRQLEEAEDSSNSRTVLAAIREQRGNLELAARVAKLISDAPVVNILNNPQFLQLQQVVVDALEPYPEARLSVADALDRVRGE